MNQPNDNEVKDSEAADWSTLSYEEAVRELEEIVVALEDGNVPLGESLQMVQRGRELSEACAKMLEEAELTLSRLAASSDGELVEEELDWDAENE